MAANLSIARSLRFSLLWAPFGSIIEAKTLTTAQLTVQVDGRPIWPVRGAAEIGLEIFADDLLSHLTEFWKPLMLRQTYPVDRSPERPSLLRQFAMARWAELSATIRANEDDRITRFEEAHDLGQAFSGQYGLPPLYLFRTGDSMIVDTQDEGFRVPFETAKVALSEIGDYVATRLADDPRAKWSRLIAAWYRRNEGRPGSLLAWSTSLKPEIADRLLRDRVLSAPTSVSQAANDDDELRLAARMTSALPEDHIRRVLELVRGFPPRNTSQLDALSETLREFLEENFPQHSPFEQGLAAASEVRRFLRIASVRRVDPFELIETLGADIRCPSVEPATLDALAIWGPRHGPGVLVNAGGNRVRAGTNPRLDRASRITAAHELCHLLLDRGHALSAVDILKSRMPLPVEQRARAFAGELLLPSHVAADIWVREGSSLSGEPLKSMVQRLARTYGVSVSVAAWKLQHGLERRDIDLSNALDEVAPSRWGGGRARH